jgi:hypothetical protein
MECKENREILYINIKDQRNPIRNGGKNEMMLFSETVSKMFQEHRQAYLGIVYHYTNLDGMLGILNSQSLWASNIEFLNDSVEYEYGVNLCKLILDERLLAEKQDEIRNYLQIIMDLLDKPKGDIYSLSFCQSGDLLSQWRGYGNNDASVAIGFSIMNGLQFRATDTINEMFYPQSVVYEKFNQKALIMAIIDKGIDLIINNKYDSDDMAAGANNALRYFVLPYLKDISFQEEKELRIIIRTEKTSQKDIPLEVLYRKRGHYLLPYVVKKYCHISSFVTKDNGQPDYYNMESKLPITDIIVGPSQDQPLLVNGIKHYLNKKQMNDITVSVSAIPYRV